TMMNDPYAWWRNACAGNVGPITMEPECGFYRKRQSKGGPMVPVAIWWTGERDEDGNPVEDLRLTALVGFQEDARTVDAGEVWTFAAKHPIPEALYREAFE